MPDTKTSKQTSVKRLGHLEGHHSADLSAVFLFGLGVQSTLRKISKSFVWLEGIASNESVPPWQCRAAEFSVEVYRKGP